MKICLSLNEDIANRVPGEKKLYFSFDRVRCINAILSNDYPILIFEYNECVQVACRRIS